MPAPIQSSDFPLYDRKWRLTSGKLYHIKDAHGNKVPFVPNAAQLEFLEQVWYKNIILKARQLGFTTLIEIILLDACLFETDILAGVIAQDLENARLIFREKIRFAFDHLPLSLKRLYRVSSNSVNELAFSNGSRIRVGTSFRGGAYQYLHISEFGKICAASAEKAREIVTGALNSVHSQQYVFIESTAEGASGHFFTLCQTARIRNESQKQLSDEEYRFFFFPWWKESKYRSQTGQFGGYSAYFATLQDRGIELCDEQKSWYARKADILREDMFREYPSFPEEAFFRSLAGSYYERDMERVRREGRIRGELYDKALPVHTAWDLGGAGGGDETAIWFFQRYGHEIWLVDYLEASGYSMAEYIDMLATKPYEYGEHFAPHDIRVHEYTSWKTRWETARELGVTFRVAPRVSLSDGIGQVRKILQQCLFDATTTTQGVRALQNYRRKYDEVAWIFLDAPFHNEFSHGADAFRTLALGLREEYAGSRIISPSVSLNPFEEEGEEM